MKQNMTRDFSKVPPFIQDREILIRGTDAWDARERARQAAGCKSLSPGFIPASGGLIAKCE